MRAALGEDRGRGGRLGGARKGGAAAADRHPSLLPPPPHGAGSAAKALAASAFAAAIRPETALRPERPPLMAKIKVANPVVELDGDV